MTTIPQVASALQAVLTAQADLVGRQTRFVQRPSTTKMHGSTFVQTLAFGWLADPEATRDALAQTAAAIGVAITPQGLDQRFTHQAATCVRRVLEQSLTLVLGGEAVALPLLQRFTAVVLLDCSTITLPDALASLWPGCGGGSEQHTAAALKIGVRVDLRHGTLQGPFLEPARTHDSGSTVQRLSVERGALRLGDAGFFHLERFAEIEAQGAYWLSRLRAGTKLLTLEGQVLDLPQWLAEQSTQVAMPVLVGQHKRLRARVLAVRVPQEVADQRRRRLREEAKRKGQMVSAERLALAAWTLFLSNVPDTLLSLTEVLVIARARWQIELRFKLWKSHGKLATWRTENPWRILCEVYAKLLAMRIQHWLIVVGCWRNPDRSLPKAARTVRAHARHLASVLADRPQLEATLTTIQQCLAAGCRMNTRKRCPNTFQLRADPSLLWLGTEHNIA